MGKLRYTYGGYIATLLKERSSCPIQTDIVVQANYIDCTNINVTQVKGVLGSGETSVGGLCKSVLINKWSAFSPIIRYESGGFLLNRVRVGGAEEPFNLGDFAGYNHNAPTPAYYGTAHTNTVYVNHGSSPVFAVTADIGEALYVGGDVINKGDVVGVALTIWDGSALVGYGITPLSTERGLINLTAIGETLYNDKTYIAKVYFVNHLTNFNQNLSNVSFQLSQLPNYNVSVSVRVATSLNTAGMAGWTLDNVGLNRITRTVSFNNAYSAISDLNILIQVRLVNQQNGATETTIFFQGAYTAYQNLGNMSNVISALNPIPEYGYTAYLEAYTSS